MVEKILVEGMDTFIEHGFAGTTVDMIAKRTRTSKATIYAYFPNKEALFTAMVDRAIAEGRRLPPVDPGRFGSARELLIDYAERCIQTQASPRQISLCRIYVHEIQKFEVIEQLFSRFDDRDRKALVASFEKLFRGRLKNVTNAERAAATFWFMVITPFLLWALFRPRSPRTASERRKSIEESIDEFLRIYPPA